MKDIHSVLAAVLAIEPAVFAADNTPPSVDLQGYSAAEIVLAVGAGGITFSGTNKIEFKLTHSDDDTTYTAVEQKDMLGVTVGTGGIIKALIAAHATPAVYRAGYKGNRRYVKLLADFSGTHGTGTALSAVVLKGRGFNKPEADQA